jgi:hypothetical protein
MVCHDFAQNHGPAEREYDKKGIIVEEMDKCTRWSVASRPCITELIRHKELGAYLGSWGLWPIPPSLSIPVDGSSMAVLDK